MAVYPLQIHDGHLIAGIDGQRALIDTGSPVSFGRQPAISIGGRTYPLVQSAWAGDAASLADFVGTEIDCLIGGDILSEFRFGVGSDCIKTSDDASLATGEAIPLSIIRRLPVIECEIAGNLVRAVPDTGAKLCYALANLIADYPLIEEIDDFHPTIGRFKVGVREVPVRIGGIRIRVLMADLPDSLEGLLAHNQIEAIIGNNILLDGSALFDYQARFLQLNIGDNA